MDFDFQTSELNDLYYEGKGKEKYPDYIVRAFFKKIKIINNAKDEGDIRDIKGNHFEKLKGENNLYSIRLNDQYRLIFSIEGSNEKKFLIKEISNHYS